MPLYDPLFAENGWFGDKKCRSSLTQRQFTDALKVPPAVFTRGLVPATWRNQYLARYIINPFSLLAGTLCKQSRLQSVHHTLTGLRFRVRLGHLMCKLMAGTPCAKDLECSLLKVFITLLLDILRFSVRLGHLVCKLMAGTLCAKELN